LIPLLAETLDVMERNEDMFLFLYSSYQNRIGYNFIQADSVVDEEVLMEKLMITH